MLRGERDVFRLRIECGAPATAPGECSTIVHCFNNPGWGYFDEHFFAFAVFWK